MRTAAGLWLGCPSERLKLSPEPRSACPGGGGVTASHILWALLSLPVLMAPQPELCLSHWSPVVRPRFSLGSLGHWSWSTSHVGKGTTCFRNSWGL